MQGELQLESVDEIPLTFRRFRDEEREFRKPLERVRFRGLSEDVNDFLAISTESSVMEVFGSSIIMQ